MDKAEILSPMEYTNIAGALLGSKGAEFESLAVAVLPKLNSDYSFLIHTGVNSKGETIKDTNDSIHFTIIDGVSYVICLHYTGQENLVKKWLYRGTEKTRKGDLISAIEKIQPYQKDYPNHKFRVVLCTSQIAGNSELIIEEKLKVEKEYKIEVDIIEHTKLKNFLKNTAYGQWIAHVHLQITAKLLSRELLSFIGKKSIEDYKYSSFFPHEAKVIKRDISNVLLEKILNSNIYLIGESGMGKSFTCMDALESLSKKGHSILRLHPDTIRNNQTLNRAIFSELKNFHPSIYEPEFYNLFAFIEDDKKFFIYCDDINKEADTTKLLAKILQWSSQLDINSPIKIICPLQPKFENHIHKYIEKESKGRSEIKISNSIKFQILHIGKYTQQEGLSFLRKKIPDTPELKLIETLDALNYDPLLLGVVDGQNIQQLSSKIILENYIHDTLKDFADDNKEIFSKVKSSLTDFAIAMLENKQLYPLYSDVEKWFKNKMTSLEIINGLIFQRMLFLVDDRGVIHFKHDRIHEAIVLIGLEELLLKNQAHENILLEPFYADIVGKAIVNVSLKEEILDEILMQNPVALAFALNNFSAKTPIETKDLIHQKLHQLFHSGLLFQYFDLSVSSLITTQFMHIDAPEIINLTKGGASFVYSHINLSRFRNGDVIGFVGYLKGYSTDFHGFDFDDRRRNYFIEIAKSKYKTTLIEDLRNHLVASQTEEAERIYLIIAAGYLQYSELFYSIFQCWQNANDKRKILHVTIWAMLHCYQKNLQDKFNEVIQFWKKNKDLYILKNLQENWSNLNEAAIQVILKWFEQNDFRKNLALNILSYQDSPKVLKKLLLNEDYWRYQKHHFTGVPRIYFFNCKNTYFEIYSDKTLDRDKQLEAFRIWLYYATKDDLSILQTITLDDNILFAEVIWKRLYLGDHSVKNEIKPQLKSLIESYPRWLRIVPQFWNKDLKAMLLELANNIDLLFEIVQITYLLPKNDADEILFSCWSTYFKNGLNSLSKQNYILASFIQDRSRNLPGFISEGAEIINATLVQGGNASMNQLQIFLEKITNPKPFFLQFGFYLFREKEFYGWHYQNQKLRTEISEDTLNRVLPFIDFLENDDLRNFISECFRLGHHQWLKENLLTHFENRVKPTLNFVDWQLSYFTSKVDILEVFEDLVSPDTKFQRSYLPNELMKKLEKQGYSIDEILTLSEKWLVENPTIRKYDFVASLIADTGSRKHLEILDNINIQNDLEKMESIKRNTHYKLKIRTLE